MMRENCRRAATRAAGGRACAAAAGAVGNAYAQGDAKRGQYLVKAGGCVGCHTRRQEGRRCLCRRPRAQDAFRHVLRTEHHAAPAGRDRALDRGRFHPRHAPRQSVRTAPIISPHFPTRRSRGSPTPICATSGPTCARFPRATGPVRSTTCVFPSAGASSSRSGSGCSSLPGRSRPTRNCRRSLNRGAYLVQALGHCGECHTPRNFLGGPKRDRFLAGGKGPRARTYLI